MALDVLIFIIGLALAAMTLRDVFETVIVPGGSEASLRVTKRLLWMLLPLWKGVRGKRRGLSGAFGPLVLVLSFVIWIALLALGFGLMAFAIRGHFDPVLRNMSDAIYMVGSSIVTIGVSEENALGAGRWLVLAAGFCGLAVMTMAVTYLLQVQSSVSKRDVGIIKLNTAAGEPPSAITMLERLAALDDREEILNVLREGRDWCATVRQSHSNHPSLIYFQSVGTGAGWPAALGALLDLALLSEQCLDDRSLVGPAVLLRAEATRMARELAGVIGLHPGDVDGDEARLRQAARRLEDAGYVTRPDPAFPVMAEQRAEYVACVDALANHLGKPTSVLLRQE